MLRTSITVLLCTLIFISCGSTSQITNTWVKPQANTANIDRIMVLAMVGNNRELRQEMETSLANNLRKLGYNAESSFAQYGPQMFDIENEEDALKQIKDHNADAVLTVVMLDKERERYYVPGNMAYTPYGMYYNRFWGYYTTLYDRTYSPGYYTTNTNYFWESNLYNVNTGELIYSAQTKSFNPSSASSLAEDYGELIVNNLMKNGLVQRATATR